jgi:hypothetical protein
MARVEQEIDRLFGLPLQEFVGARNELARRLKQEGDAETSNQVKQLDKPNVVAWTINQLARQHKDAVRILLGAGAKLSKAQERALQSVGSADQLRRAQAEERQAIRELTQQAQQILEAEGRPTSSAVLNRIASSLRAAVVSEAGRGMLKAGRLTGEVKPSGFEALAGFEVGQKPPQRNASPRDELAERRLEKEELKRQRRDLKERVRKLSARVSREEREAERAEKAAATARQAAEASRRELETAEADLEKLDQ